MDVSSLKAIRVDSSVAGAILHRRTGSSLSAFLKQSEWYSWSVYMMRYKIIQGEGDNNSSVPDRAITMPPVEPHDSVRERRSSGERQRGPTKSSAEDPDGDIEMSQEAAEEDAGDGTGDEGQSSESDSGVQPRRGRHGLVLRKKIRT